MYLSTLRKHRILSETWSGSVTFMGEEKRSLCSQVSYGRYSCICRLFYVTNKILENVPPWIVQRLTLQRKTTFCLLNWANTPEIASETLARQGTAQLLLKVWNPLRRLQCCFVGSDRPTATEDSLARLSLVSLVPSLCFSLSLSFFLRFCFLHDHALCKELDGNWLLSIPLQAAQNEID